MIWFTAFYTRDQRENYRISLSVSLILILLTMLSTFVEPILERIEALVNFNRRNE